MLRWAGSFSSEWSALGASGGSRGVCSRIAAASAIGSIFIARGSTSAVLAVPWAITGVIGMAGGLSGLTPKNRERPEVLIATGAFAFQVIAALMLVAWRGHFNPFGLDDTAIGLGAAYLQFVGFGSNVLASEIAASTPAPEQVEALREAVGVGAATLLIAIGLVAWVPIAFAGALSLVVTCARLAVESSRRLARASRSWSTALSRVSVVGVSSAALIGILYGVEGPLGRAWLTAQQALRISATIACLGFVVPGLLAWFIRAVQGSGGSGSV